MDFPFAAGPVEFVGMGDDAASNIEQLLSSILPRSLRDIEAFAAAAARAPPAPTAGEAETAETAPGALALVRAVAARIAAKGGAALFVDYGYSGDAPGDTLRGFRRHAQVDPLSEPGSSAVLLLGHRVAVGLSAFRAAVSSRST